MKKNKGFTLVELLAIIVILAIIMLIAIPIVLDTIASTNVKAFMQYYERTFNQAEKKYTADIANAAIDEDSCIIYNIKTELGFENTGSFDGYVLIDKEGDKYITLFNDEYMIVAKKYDNNLKKDDLKIYVDNDETKKILSAEYLCNQSKNCDSCKLKVNKTEEEIKPIGNITMLQEGTKVNVVFKKIADYNFKGNYFTSDKKIKKIVYEVTDDNEGTIISTEDSKYNVYASFSDGVITIKSKAEEVYLNPYSNLLFDALINVEEIDLSHFNTKVVYDMHSMFEGCQSIEYLDISKFSTSNVNNMSWMFRNCYKLNNIDLSSFDTANVTDMSYMFSYCKNITKLDVSGFITDLVTDMNSMFYYNENLLELDVSNFKTGKVTSFSWMFEFCSKLKHIDVSGFDTRSAINMAGMFAFCYSLEEIDLSHFVTDNVTSFSQFLYADKKINYVDVSNFRTSNAIDMSGMFYWLSIEELDLSHFDTSKVIEMDDMFGQDYSLKYLNISNFDTSKVKNMNRMFCYTKIEILDLSSFDTSSLTDLGQAFYDMGNLKRIIVSDKWTTKNVTDFSLTFEGCYNLDVSFFKKIDTSNATNMYRMFSGYKTEILDLRGFDTSKVFDMNFMFGKVEAKELRLDTFEFSNVQYHGGNPYYNGSINGPMFTDINDDMIIYVKDEAAKEFVEARLVEAEKTNTVVIAS